MENQRRLLTFITLSLALMLFWNHYVVPWLVPAIPRPQALLDQNFLDRPDDTPVSALTPANQPVVAPIALNVRHPRRRIELGSTDPTSGFFLHVRLSSQGAAIESITLNDPRYPEVGDRTKPLTVVGHDPISKEKTFALSISELERLFAPETLETIDWEVLPSDDASSVEFRLVTPDGHLELRKKYELTCIPKDQPISFEKRDSFADGYFVRLTVSLINHASHPRTLRYELRGPVGLPLEDPENSVKHRDIRLGFLESGGTVDERTYSAREAVKKHKAHDVEIWKRPLQYIGVDTQYFAALVHPQADQLVQPTIESSYAEVLSLGARDEYADLSVRLTTAQRQLEAQGVPGDRIDDSYLLFAGPKREQLLAPLKAEGVLDYGWFAPLVKLMLWILTSLHDLGLNYGLSIVGLTCLVRACIFPLSRYQARSMERMKELQPRIRQLHEKHKKNPESLTPEEIRTLQEVNLRMMWGCLPLMAQLPIFFALYRSLQVSVDLRMAPMHVIGNWIDNLAAPDALFPLGFRLPLLGWTEFNLLPILTVTLFIVNQKLTMPPPADEEQALQYKMMNIMMGVMGIFFYRVPSGLCVYFITSSAWGLAERMLIKRWTEVKASEENASITTVPSIPPVKPTVSQEKPATPGLLQRWRQKLAELQQLADKPPAAMREQAPKGSSKRRRSS
ncbi:MAG: hypothetical protein KatS3mg113_0854 [Planctomycetaceae bacterium]|nr:MAG: hypothetical protein KatS3mg113_0854 [Planctomycetaceae bacterium]